MLLQDRVIYAHPNHLLVSLNTNKSSSSSPPPLWRLSPLSVLIECVLLLECILLLECVLVLQDRVIYAHPDHLLYESYRPWCSWASASLRRRRRSWAPERERETREREGEGGRERGREKFIDNQIDDWRSVSTTPLQGDTAAGHLWPSIGGEYYPHSVQPRGRERGREGESFQERNKD